VEEGQNSLEGSAEGHLQLRVRGLCRLFHGRQGVEAEVHPAAAEVPPCLVRLVRKEVEAALPQP
jgi:hypothetical protein